ncbi:hypothetical protein R2R70_17515 [Cobetia sp. SIMBA_158]|uniref:hypothetical protein n=1 Tax=Cobetia sp. SIMBA_158 TaxID=3081617 RepID=UPI00397F2DC0
MAKDKLPPYQVVAYFYNELDCYDVYVKAARRMWHEETKNYDCGVVSEEGVKGYDYRSDLSYYISDEFPQHQNKAHVLMLVSLFEDFLIKLVNSVEAHCCEPYLPFERNKKQGILDRAKEYLKQQGEISLPVKNPAWSFIKDLVFIRNLIAHAGGCIDKKKNIAVARFVDRESGLHVESYARDYLIVHDEFVDKIIKEMKGFAKAMLDNNPPNKRDCSLI